MIFNPIFNPPHPIDKIHSFGLDKVIYTSGSTWEVLKTLTVKPGNILIIMDLWFYLCFPAVDKGFCNNTLLTGSISSGPITLAIKRNGEIVHSLAGPVQMPLKGFNLALDPGVITFELQKIAPANTPNCLLNCTCHEKVRHGN